MSSHAHLHGSYEPALVILSLLIAILAGYSTLDLAGRVAAARGAARIAWLAGGAFALGSGIWAMHFTGMLAHVLPFPVSYDLPTVILSLVIAVVIAWPALQISGGARLTPPRLLGGGALVGAGILAMHYSGMWALRQVVLTYNPTLVLLSVVIAVGAATVAIRIAFALRETSGAPAFPRKLGAAVILGIAIAGMHYTGMAATAFAGTAEPTNALALSSIALPLGVGIAVVSLLILGLVIGLSLLDRRLDRQSRALMVANEQYRSLFDRHPDAVFALDSAGTCRSLNPNAADFLGQVTANVVGRSLLELAPPEAQPLLHSALEQTRNGIAAQNILPWPGVDGTLRRWDATYIPMVIDDAITGVYLIAHDETARYAAEIAQQQSTAALDAARVEQQQLLDTLAEMDTPILPVADGVLVVPLIGPFDETRSDRLQARTLVQTERTRAHTIVLDITGVPVVDTAAARALINLSQALRMLGTRCIVVGLSPEVAQTVVQLGLGLDTLITRRDLRDGIATALQR